MPRKKTVSTEVLLKDPKVQEITSNINPEIIERRKNLPPICDVFNKPYTALQETDQYTFRIDSEAARQLPGIIDNKVQGILGIDDPDPELKSRYERARNIGIVFSGGPAPGGHNVIAGLFDAAMAANPESRIYGFLLGPDGIIENEAVEITKKMVDRFRNLGGFGMIKTGRAKVDTKEKMEQSRQTCKALGLDALVIVGGDDSNTNAAFMAQELLRDGVQVIGVPKTIDGDIQVRDAEGNSLCAISFGFHSAARGFSSEIANLCTDCSSDVKYWHICKVMGRVASHLALEVGLQTHANVVLIGEEMADYVDVERIRRAEAQGTVDYTAYGMTLRHLSRVICDAIVRRAAVGKSYGVLVLPEGVLEFVNEIQVFIIKFNSIIAAYNRDHDTDFHADFPLLEEKLEYLRRMARRSREDGGFTVWNTRDDDLFNDLPIFFQEGLLMERDSHGNFQFSQVETDKVIMGLVKDYLNILKENGVYKVGIEREYYQKSIRKSGLDADYYGKILFRNYTENGSHLLVRESIISLKTLHQALEDARAIKPGENIQSAVEAIYKKSVPTFKTQTHFYGYDGRGSNPTWFDRTYTYNLGKTAFSLIANGATGQMAAIRNLEREFVNWEPIGIPIGPLMHLEERKGKLALVIEKAVVDIESPAFQVIRAQREKWLAATPGDDDFRIPPPIYYDEGNPEEDRPLTLTLDCLAEEIAENAS